MTYLLVHEDASLTEQVEITEEDKRAVDDGILDIVRRNAGQYEYYAGNDSWRPVVKVSTD